jgi:hypothetical protein
MPVKPSTNFTPGIAKLTLDVRVTNLNTQLHDPANVADIEDNKNLLAPHLFQQQIGADNPIGAIIDYAQVRLAVTRGMVGKPKQWDKMVFFAGLDEDGHTLRPTIHFYKSDWTPVLGVLGGGGGPGSVALSTPPPTL